jgi:class 3 adenylate cyclase
VADSFSRAEAATRAGVEPAFLDRLVQLGIVTIDGDGAFSASQVKRAQLTQALATGGVPLEGLAAAITSGELSLDFLDSEAYERFATLSDVTFRELSERTGTPVELLMVIREAVGGALPSPDDHVRDDELAVADFVEAQRRFGFRPIAIERLLRVTGDSLRRIAEQEADWWRTEVLEPRLAVGGGPAALEAAQGEMTALLAALGDSSIMAMYHAHQSHAWTSNIIQGFEMSLARAGLHRRLERPPAMCFLDISGYTRLTHERGDEAAAGLATDLSLLVQRTSTRYGGKPVKWLGDGVMLYFKEPGAGVVAALDMVDGVAISGLPPAHVGLHAGPILYQAGDYFGGTVNAASRIADYARPGEVLVSQEVVDASAGAAASFTEIGPVELKGLGAALRLHVARRA